jgi:hypothetical protein
LIYYGVQTLQQVASEYLQEDESLNIQKLENRLGEEDLKNQFLEKQLANRKRQQELDKIDREMKRR